MQRNIMQRKDTEQMYGQGTNIFAVIAAAGKGSRMEMTQNKQYIDVLDKPVLARTVQVFENCDEIDGIVIIAAAEEIEYCRINIVEKYKFRKVRAIIAGGASRQQSVFNGLCGVSSGCGIVLIHDGARPFVDNAVIIDCIRTAAEYGAAVAAVPIKDTVKRADCDGFVDATIDRESLWSVQTPQAFRYPLIMEAHQKAAEDGYTGTDDSVLVERIGCKVRLVMGSYYNIKITTREDLVMAEAIAGLRKFDVHRE